MMRLILLFCCLSLFAAGVSAQTGRPSDKDYSRKALWIQMMDDPDVNFLEIEKAYTLYWQHHELPESEHEMMEEQNYPKVTRRNIRRVQAEIDMSMAVRKYAAWRRGILPYVLPDGRIMSVEERLKIWEAR